MYFYHRLIDIVICLFSQHFLFKTCLIRLGRHFVSAYSIFNLFKSLYGSWMEWILEGVFLPSTL